MFARVAEKLKSIPAGHTLIAALSGGVDSVVLLDLCARFRDEAAPECGLIAAHLNHCLRGEESEGDENFCAELCEKMSVPLHKTRRDIAALAERGKLGIEETARNARRGFFRQLGEKHFPATVLLGHHSGDQAETVLMNIVRGTGLNGLGGIPAEGELFPGAEKPVMFMRPLLDFSRTEILAYAKERNLRWREDSSNFSNVYTRNRVRHELLPLLENLRPGVERRLASLARQCRQDEDYLTEIARGEFRKHVSETAGGLLVSPEAASLPPALIGRLLASVCEKVSGLRLPDADAIMLLTDLLQQGRVGAMLQLPHDLRARKETDGVFLFLEKEETAPTTVEIANRFPLTIETDSLIITGEIFPAGQEIFPPDLADHEVEWLNLAALKFPLTVRARQPGDRFHPLGAPGGCKVKDFLIGAHVPQREKENCLVVSDQTGIVWVWPFRLGERVKLVGASSEHLRLTIRRK
jgi:tRNA(Ile)-lysidine synthase